MLDNTWGTPLNFRSFQHGVDISLHAATKYIGGHSDPPIAGSDPSQAARCFAYDDETTCAVSAAGLGTAAGISCQPFQLTRETCRAT